MSGMIERGGARRAIGLLFVVIGALPVATSAAPIRDLPHDESSSSWTDTGDRLSIVGVAVQEVRRTGPGVSPGLVGIDDGFLANGNLVHSEVRQQVNIPLPT